MEAEDQLLLASLRTALLDCDAPQPGEDLTLVASRVVERELPMLGSSDRALLVRRLVADAAGYGPIERLLADRRVDEVMVNGHDEIWVERAGRLERTDVRFDSVEALRDAIDRLLGSAGRRVDTLSPIADARLDDGSRVNVILPPLAVNGPTMTIRRFRPGGYSLDDLVRLGTIDERLGALLAAAVIDRLNVVVSGATGCGKTTTLAALAGEIPVSERVVTIEDAAELHLDHPHVVRLEARPRGASGAGEVLIRDLVRNALRMRPDRIVVGEVRGGESIDMLDAMATGHAGSLSTVHAGSPSGALRRIASLAHQAELGLPHEAIAERVGAAIDMVVHQVRRSDGSRCVERVAVVEQMDAGPRACDIFRSQDGAVRWRVLPKAERFARLRFG